MNLRATVASSFASLACANAAVIDHDAVVPFAQPTPTATLQTLAVKFKPQICIANGCHPYPAVGKKDGNASGGLKPTGSQSSGCTGSSLGSQIYGRAVEYGLLVPRKVGQGVGGHSRLEILAKLYLQNIHSRVSRK
ncbi:unnamed protein product [Phytophthora lilii]|uniref:Unnamed protein product n=1 Tax=Phytophthora lilii TaxID=2077276 RepID=A0A9W6WU13_9STRA|nr:unnamed protein product [Phytophthora lilii]